MVAPELVVLHLPANGGNAIVKRVTGDAETFRTLIGGGDLEIVGVTSFTCAYADENGFHRPGARPNMVFNDVLNASQAPAAAHPVYGDVVVFGFPVAGYEQDIGPEIVSLARSVGARVVNLTGDAKFD